MHWALTWRLLAAIVIHITNGNKNLKAYLRMSEDLN